MKLRNWLIRKLGHSCDALLPIGTASLGGWRGMPISRVFFDEGMIVVQFEAGTMTSGALEGRVTVYDLDGNPVLWGLTDHSAYGVKTRGSTWKMTDHIKLVRQP